MPSLDGLFAVLPGGTAFFFHFWLSAPHFLRFGEADLRLPAPLPPEPVFTGRQPDAPRSPVHVRKRTAATKRLSFSLSVLPP